MRYSKFFMLAIFSLLFSQFSCRPDEKPAQIGSVLLNFSANYGSEPFVANKKYDYSGGKQAFFSLFHFFVCDVELIKKDGSAVKLSEIEYVNLTKSDLASAQNGETFRFSKIPAEDYSEIRFGIGVKPNLNSTNPSSLPDSNPLTVNGRSEFWDAWQSYIFMKIEGKYDYNGDGGVFEVPFLYHCGSDPVYRVLNFQKPISVVFDAETPLFVNVDLKKILTENDQPYDIKNKPATSDTPGNVIVASELVKNFPTAFKLN